MACRAASCAMPRQHACTSSFSATPRRASGLVLSAASCAWQVRSRRRRMRTIVCMADASEQPDRSSSAVVASMATLAALSSSLPATRAEAAE
eukprot:4250147-Pleurochrysis_carterae.AAC.1